MTAIWDFLKKYRRVFILLVSATVFAVVFVLSFVLRLGGWPDAEQWRAVAYTLPALVILKCGIFAYYRLDRGTLRYANFDDLMRILKASTICSAGLMGVAVFAFRLEGFPRSVFIIDWMGTILAFGGQRFAVRALWTSQLRRRVTGHKPLKRTLIAGAGCAGTLAIRELRNRADSARKVIGFVDDDPGKEGALVQGKPVLGPLAETAEIIEDENIDELLIAMPSAPKQVVRELTEQCSGKVDLCILPAMIDFITGEREAQPIRDVQLRDLLGRDPVSMDHSHVREDLSGKCVLVSGAAGSIGSELARQITEYEPDKLVLLDMAESALFDINHELKRNHGGNRVPVVADVRDPSCLDRVLSKHDPDAIFHAAAYKHVPLMESHPLEAAENNVLGTRNIAKAAVEHDVGRFVMVSTDKAVKPENVMGATKRAAEMIVSMMNGNGTEFMAVRFGNVLGSNGSVIPTFRRQIEEGGPVTVTHPEVTRYFMTIPEAAELVLQAGTIGQNGDIFVLDMGDPVKILDLARDMIVLRGRTPGEDINIEITGLRPGEKLHEELVDDKETIYETNIPGLKKISKSTLQIDSDVFEGELEQLDQMVRDGDEDKVRSMLFDMTC